MTVPRTVARLASRVSRSRSARNEQVRANWTEIFAGVPDFRSELIGAVADGDTVWTEWHWQGTDLDIAGVIVFGVRDGLFAWARLYVEPVEQGEGIEAAVQEMSGRGGAQAQP